jgi:hypothetical protein
VQQGLAGQAELIEFGQAPLRADERKVFIGKSYYLCDFGRRRDGSCPNKHNMRAEPIADAVFGALLELAGHRRLRTKRLIAGRDRSEDMAAVQEQIVHLEREILKARMERKEFSHLQVQKDAANAEMDRLIDIEHEPARIE